MTKFSSLPILTRNTILVLEIHQGLGGERYLGSWNNIWRRYPAGGQLVLRWAERWGQGFFFDIHWRWWHVEASGGQGLEAGWRCGWKVE